MSALPNRWAPSRNALVRGRRRRCDVSFEVLPGFAYFSHDELNRQTDNLNWDLFYCDAFRDFYTVLGIERFDHAGVRGA
jgi:hypothetical protein